MTPILVGAVYGAEFGPAGTAAGIGVGFLFQLGEALYNSATKLAMPDAQPGYYNAEINFQSGFH
jgi:hypothetical protein